VAAAAGVLWGMHRWRMSPLDPMSFMLGLRCKQETVIVPALAPFCPHPQLQQVCTIRSCSNSGKSSSSSSSSLSWHTRGVHLQQKLAHKPGLQHSQKLACTLGLKQCQLLACKGGCLGVANAPPPTKWQGTQHP